jgi:hypothetical protein
MTAASRPGALPAFQDVRRRLANLRPGAATASTGILEHATAAPDAPRIVAAQPIEHSSVGARRVAGAPAVGFDAFLDGTQTSRILDFVNGVAVVHGTVAAVIRVRRNRRMATWIQAVEQRLYAPRRALPGAYWDSLESLGLDVVDTSDDPPAGGGSPGHPFTLRDGAVNRVGRDRERLEVRLAERWCGMEKGMLFIDGGISGSERVSSAGCTVGVVKSHRTLYVEGDALTRVLALEAGERSTVLRIAPPKRHAVASWYLRLRDPAGHDPMWGLVRVETADLPVADRAAITERADLLSRWILAEAAPLALPDGRWDKMVYGIRDCEEFLRAVAG